jgi:hypothetical protein
MSSFVPFDDARTLLKAAALVPSANIAWPNEPFAEPTGDPPALWLAVECTGDTLLPVEIDDGTGGVWQETGMLFVHVMTPAGTGSDAARTLAKSVANVFRGLGARNVIYRRASIGNGIAADPQGIWWNLTVSVQWIYQDIVSP